MADEIKTVQVRGEGGAIWEMDLPLPAGVQQRIDAGHIKIVGGAEPEPDPEPDLDEDDLNSEEDEQPAELAAFLDTPPEPVTPALAKPTRGKAKP